MASGKKIPSHGENAFTDQESVGLINRLLARHKRVAANLTAHDSWANTDGDLDIQNEQAEIIGSFKAQAKTLAKTGVLKFNCPVGFLNYCTDIQPVMLLVADNEAEKVYWQYIDADFVKQLAIGEDQQNKTLDLVEAQSFSKSDTKYIDEWTQLFIDKKLQLSALTRRINEALTNEIDVGKGLLEQYRYTEALEYLTDLKDRRWEEADNHSKFRILANIAAAQCNLDQQDIGAKSFLEAYEYQPDLPKALTNKATAHLINEEYAEALAAANSVLEKNPLDVNATSAKVQAMASLGSSLDEIGKSLDKTVIESSIVLHALASAANRLGNKAQVSKYLEEAIVVSEDPYIRADLGINILDSIINDDPAAAKGMLTAQQKVEVRKAADLLELAWKAIPDDRDKKYRSDWLFDLGMAYRVLGLECDAEKVNEELLSLKPDSELYIKDAAVMAIRSKNPELAESYLRQLIDNGTEMPEVPIMLVDALRLQNKNEDALAVAREYLNEHKEKDDSYVAMSENLFDVLIDLEKYDDAQILADKFIEEDADSLLGLLFSARMAYIKQDTESSLRFLENAELQINESTQHALIYGMAEQAYSLEAFPLAARAYKRVFRPTADSPIAQRYLRSLYESKQYESLIEVAKVIREASGSSEMVTQFEWAAYLELQDLPGAKSVLDTYIAEHAGDENAKLSRAIIYLRQEDKKSLNAYLASDIDLTKLSLLSEIQLSNLYSMSGNPERALEVIYDVRRRHPNDADAHSAYTSIFLGLESSVRKVLTVKTVGPNSVIKYDGGHFIIEDDYDPEISNNEISVKDAESRGFLAKKKGETIVLSKNHLTTNEAKITEVQSKYVYAFQDSIQNFERRFSGRHDMMGFNVESNNFDPLFKQLDESQKTAETTENLYKEGKLTIDLFAKLVGKNLIEVYYALMNVPDIGIRVANGTVEEAEKRPQLLDSDNHWKIVADITALITLYTLGVKPKDIELEKLTVSQSTKDLLTALITEMDGIGRKKMMTLYKRNGQYIRQETTAKEQRDRVNNLKRLRTWINSNTTVEALSQAQLDVIEEKSKEPKQLEEIINQAQFDTLRLAIGDGRLLYSDDVGLRSLSENTFGTKGIWTQAILLDKTEIGSLSTEEYERLTIEIVNHSYHHVSISPQVIMRAAEMAHMRPDQPLVNVLKTISRPETTVVSLITVLVNFLYELYGTTSLQDKSLIVQLVLNEATRHRDKKEFVGLFLKGVETRFKLNPLALDDIRKTTAAWLALHNL